MNFNKHYNLEGRHAFLGASKYHWINYDEDRLTEVYQNFLAAQRGTELHELAAKCIKHGLKAQKSKKTLNRYINDAIGFKMQPEQILYYSDNCFGTADAISFRKEHGKYKLRIHDLKTGVTPAHMEQLMIYTALFCMEYGNQYNFTPDDIDIELRIYQCDDVIVFEPDPEDIYEIMNKIIKFDRVIDQIKENTQ